LITVAASRPAIAVVIVTHGAWALTQQAIDALRANTEHSFELIVVDNASEDETRQRLSTLPNIRVIVNDRNRGFGPAVNQGAALASSEYLLLLNSDAFVERGWLDPLLETVQEEGVGAVVPCPLHPDGSVQDAGLLLARDATVLVYGDGEDAGRLEYRFKRVIDTGTAACMLIRRHVFNALDGFDECYAPAYYEDVDLCMRLRARGLSVVYEPRSRVTHVRYGSGSVSEAHELSQRNRAMFLGRWGSQLGGRPATFRFATTQAVIAARDAMTCPRVLICASIDHPSAGAVGSAVMRVWPSARVTWALDGGADPVGASDAWLRMGVEVVCEPDFSWLEERLFHYDLVLLGADSDSGPASALDRTQPQAPRLSLSDLSTSQGGFDEVSLRQFATAGLAPVSSGKA
jgi:GT2 family glycosyltransferase